MIIQNDHEFKDGEMAWSPAVGWAKCVITIKVTDHDCLRHGSRNYYKDGRYLTSDLFPTVLTVAERALLGDFPPKTKIKKTWWINIYKDLISSYDTKEEADLAAAKSARIECREIVVEWEE